MRRIRIVSAFCLLLPTTLNAQKIIPSPREVFGFEMGTDRQLVSWPEIVRYFATLANTSDRVRLQEMGKTTLGRPFIALLISAPENIQRLDYFRTIQQRLADPRGLTPSEADGLIRDGKAIVLITCNIHSPEIASSQTAVEFVYRLAVSNDESTLALLRNTILLLVPSLNPDGQQMVVDWYRKYKGTPSEASPLPVLYHHYAGHDNNRDWYMFTQVETQMAVDKLHNVWHPQIVYDVHQMGVRAARIFVPPWVDPIDPNIDPILQMMTLVVGTGIATDLTAAGKKGVLMNAMFDAWAPSRHYQYYHGGIRILTESASARIASPVTVPFDQLEQGRGFNLKQATWNHPDPWPGGEWHLRDIIDYQLIAFKSVLETAARERERLIRNFYLVGTRAVGRKDAFAFIIPAHQKDPINTAIMLEVLKFGMVEVFKTRTPLDINRKAYGPDSYVIPLAQPYGAWAKTLLERQTYPDLRQYPGGPPLRPYDVTAHTLPLLMGVDIDLIREPFQASMTRLDKIVPPDGEVRGISGRAGFLISHAMTEASLASNRILKAGYRLHWLMDPCETHGVRYTPGGIYLPPVAGLSAFLAKLARETNMQIEALNEVPQGRRLDISMPKIGIYQSYVPSVDEGWTRWTLERFEFPYASLTDRDVQSGGLKSKFDVIVIPDQQESSIVEGWPKGVPAGRDMGWMPDEYTGGIGQEGIAALREFVISGGTLVTLNRAAAFAIHALGLPVKNLLGRTDANGFFCPGSLLRVAIDIRHPIAFGLSQEQAAWVEGGLAFESADPSVKAPVQYARDELLISGWLLGADKVQGRHLVLDVPKGAGRVILLGFRPQYRGQSYAMFPLFFNSLYYSTAAPMAPQGQ